MVSMFRTLFFSMAGLLFPVTLLSAQDLSAQVADDSIASPDKSSDSAQELSAEVADDSTSSVSVLGEGEGVIAKISHFDGSRFIITTGEKSKTYDTLLGDWTDTSLHVGQTLVTDSGTFLELEFNGIDGVKAKLSDNSMLSFISMANGSYVIKMHYGRIRIRTEPFISGELPEWPVGEEGIWITGYDISAFWQRGDMSYEIFYKKDAFETLYRTAAYAFSDQLTLVHQNVEALNKVEALSLGKKVLTSRKMLRFQTTHEWTEAEIEAIDPEVINFWMENSFSIPSATEEPLVLPAAIEEEEPLVISKDLNIVAIDPSLERKRNVSRLTGKVLFTTGVGFLVGSAIARSLVPLDPDPNNINEILLMSSFVTGGLLGTTGVGLLAYSSLLDRFLAPHRVQ